MRSFAMNLSKSLKNRVRNSFFARPAQFDMVNLQNGCQAFSDNLSLPTGCSIEQIDLADHLCSASNLRFKLVGSS